jgi:hypothetical protein
MTNDMMMAAIPNIRSIKFEDHLVQIMEQLFVWDRVLLNLRYKLTNGELGKKTVIVDPTLFRRIILSKLILSDS